VVLVGHSGAGPLLPVIHRGLVQPVVACLFVDASLPHPGQSTLDELAVSVPELEEDGSLSHAGRSRRSESGEARTAERNGTLKVIENLRRGIRVLLEQLLEKEAPSGIGLFRKRISSATRHL
jgi:hypothetical protein